MHSFSYNISGKVLGDLEQWNCNLASQSKKSHKQIHRDTSVRTAPCIFYEGSTVCLPSPSLRSLSSLHIKLTNKTMQVPKDKKERDFIIMALFISYNKYNPPCSYLFSKKILVFKNTESTISCSTSITEGSTNKTKQKLQSLWRQHFGFLAIISFDSTGANLYNMRHCLHATAFCML